MLKATLKDLWARKIRLVTTSVAVLLGIAFMSGTLVLTDTITQTFNDLFADVNRGTDAVVRAEAPIDVDFQDGAGGPDQRPRMDPAVLDTVRGVDGVALAQGSTFGFALIVGKDGKALGGGQGPPTFGGDWQDGPLNPFRIDDGRAPETLDEAVIDRKSAKDGDIAVGDRITILVPEPVSVTVVGIATFGSVDSPGGASFVGMVPEAAQQHFGEPGKIDSIGVVAADGVTQEALRDRIAAVLPGGYEVLTGAEATKEDQDSIQEGLGFFRQMLLVFAYVALFVGSYIIYNTFGIIVAQRTRELALFRALGASRRQVLRSVLVEAAAVGLIASVLGVLAGVGLATVLRAVLRSTVEVPAGDLVVSGGTIVASLVVGTLVSVAAAWMPARRASRVPPLAAMRDVAVDRSGTSLRRLVAGVAVVAVGVLALLSGLFGGGNGLVRVGFGVLSIFVGVSVLGPVIATPVASLLGAPLPSLRAIPGVLARQNVLRNPRRTAATASALMIGVALVGFITVFASSARASINRTVGDRFEADLIVDSGAFGPGGGAGLPPALSEELRALPQVATVSPMRAGLADVDGSTTFVLGLDPATFGSVYDMGVLEGSFADIDDNSIAVQRDWAEDHDVGIGDTVPAQLVQGPPLELTVRMIYEDNILANGFFMPLSVVTSGTPDPADVMTWVTVADGVALEDAQRAIEAVTASLPTAKVQTVSDFQESRTGMFNVLLGLVYVLLLLAIVIALLGIANTLALSVLERTRELGLLRAIGMSRRQMRTSVRWESILIALLGTVLGLVLGVFFGWMLSIALREEGFEVFSIPFMSLFWISVLAAVAGVIAAIWPARRAARLNVLEAIATE